MSDEDVVINKQLMTRVIVRLVQNSSRDERPEAEAANYVLGRG